MAVDQMGRSVAIDPFVEEVLRRVAEPTPVATLLRSATDPERSYAALCVLWHAGLVDVTEGDDREIAAAAPARLPEPPPSVAAIVVSHNSEADLESCVLSLRAQRYPGLHVIVVDSASSDGSAECIRAFDDLDAVLLERNDGFAAAVNAGLNRVNAQFAVVLNADVVLCPGALSAWVACADEHPRAAAVAAKMLLARHPHFLNGLGTSVPQDDWGSDNYMGLLDLGQFDGVSEVFSACFGAVLLRTSALAEIGLPDPGYFLYYEDADWCYRARLRGWSVVAAPAARVVHQFGASVSRQPDGFKLRLVVRNRLRFVLCNVGGKSFWTSLNRYVRADVRAIAGAILSRETGSAVARVRGYADLARQLPRIVGLRRARRRRVVAEPDWNLNVLSASRASLGAFPVVSAAVVDRHYRALFPVPPRVSGDPASAAG
jgi:GT2 family glycosyltransferase